MKLLVCLRAFRSHFRSWGLILLVVATAWLLSACTIGRGEVSATIYVAPVKGAPLVYLHPKDPERYRLATVGVLPFQVPPNHGPTQGAALAGLVRDVLLAKEVFPRVLQLSEVYGGFAEAIALGRRAGVDLVLAGRLHRALDATELGGARAEMSIRLINVETGNTVWHIAQAIDQPMDHHNVGAWRRIRESFSPPVIRPSRGAPPLPNMLATIVADMAIVMTGTKVVPR